MRTRLLAGIIVGIFLIFTLFIVLRTPTDLIENSSQILSDSGIKGGVVVHLGCGDGQKLTAIQPGDEYIVHGLDRSEENVAKARQYLLAKGLSGRVSVDLLQGDRLPYIDNMVNLLISDEPSDISSEEIMRVLCPGGVAYLKEKEGWIRRIKTRPDEIDEWTHYLYGPGGNPVSHDRAVSPPQGLQWIGSQLYSRHHDHMSSLSALVSSGRRIFYIQDLGSTYSIQLPSSWFLVARDAFNGAVLWKRPIDKWHPRLWPLKSGPAQLPRRLVSEGNRVFVTLGTNAPLVALDASNGEKIIEYEETQATEEIIYSGGILFLLVNRNLKNYSFNEVQDARAWYSDEYWTGEDLEIMAVRGDSGDVLWTSKYQVLPLTLAVDDRGVYFHDGTYLICLERSSGDELWRTKLVERSPVMKAFFAPNLIVHNGVVLFAGGELAGQQTGSWVEEADSMIALSAKTGEILWTAPHPASGYRSPEDLFIIDDLVWVGDTTSGRAVGEFTGRDLLTGEIRSQFDPGLDTYWFHHRCYRSKATDNFILTSRTGIEFINPKTGKWQPHHWVRGSCLYGIMPSNGLIYAPPHPCACYLEAKQSGFSALTPRSALEGIDYELQADRLVKGRSYEGGKISGSSGVKEESWTTYRGSEARSGYTKYPVSSDLHKSWESSLGGKLTALTTSNGKLFVASKEHHVLYALDLESGETVWNYIAGGRIDSPPTIYRGLVYFGSADGWIYALREDDGSLVWRFQAAAANLRLISYDQIESVWPVHGSVLIQDDVLYAVSGRSMFLDGGLHFWRLDPETGEVLSHTPLNERDAGGNDLQDYVSWLNMPVALPDILSSDGKLVYMRSQPFDLDGNRLPLERAPSSDNPDRGAVLPVQRPESSHLFSPTGFLDDTWWHRTYWLYGSNFVSGWCGYFLAGKTAPAGRIIVHNGNRVFGFGRQPEFYRWTTPLEHHLFAAEKFPNVIKSKDARGRDDQQIEYLWSQEIPLLARAMVLADKTLFIAGPPDTVDETEAAKHLRNPQIEAQLAEQDESFKGKRGGLMWAVSTEDGTKMAEYELDSPPVFDGMAAAQGRIFVSTVNGKVICMKGE
jgi:outer membrane protein assembly factor BamB